jgi:hypothetical protein
MTTRGLAQDDNEGTAIRTTTSRLRSGWGRGRGRFGGAAQTQGRREARESDLGEEAAVDEEDRDGVSVTASQFRV